MTPSIFNVIEAIIVAMSVGLLCWLAAKVVGLAELVSMHGNQIVDIASRVNRLETAVLVAAQTPGKLEAVAVRLDHLMEGQRRFERLMEEHLNKQP